MKGLTLRPMNEADRDAVGSAGFAAWRSSGAFDDSYLDPAVIERVRGEFAGFAGSPTGDVVVAEVDGVVVGWGARAGAPGDISDLWVDPRWQGNGIGAAIIGHLIEKMRAQNISLATISTHAKNHAAIRLYQRCGFDIAWRGVAWSDSMKVDLEKVRLEREI